MTVDTLILLPGLDGTGTLFGDLIGEFSPTLTVTIARYPTDRFFSYPELVSCATEIMPPRPFIVVAESFSTPLAVMLAARRPPNLAGLVLCAGFIANPLGNWGLLIKMLARPLLFRLSPPRLVLEHLLIGANPPNALETNVRHALRLVNPEVLARRVRAILDCDARDDLARTRIPMMYIQAKNDRLVQAECFEEVQRLRPDIVLTSIPAPHFVLQREPGRAAQAIMRFIRQLSS